MTEAPRTSLQQAATSAVLVGILVVLAAVPAFASVEPNLTSPLQLQAAKPLPYDPATITVRFEAGTRRERIAGVVADSGCTVAKTSLYVPGLCEIRIPAGADFRQWVARFAARPDVRYAEPTFIDRIAFTPNDPRFGEQWHLSMIGVESAWDRIGGGSASVVVCVLDTGVAYENHGTYVIAPDLDGVSFVHPRDIVNDDFHANDDNQHGTHVCGTVAQRTNNGVGVAGVAHEVSVMPVKTLASSGAGTHGDFADGVTWAVDHGAHIINYSGGGSDSPTKHDAVKYAASKGVLFVAAAGNAGVNTLDYPGRYDEAMGVGAVDVGKARAWYSNWGPGLDVVAPGGETSPNASGGVLQQTFRSGDPAAMGYYFMQGTSMATPHVSGLAALLWSHPWYGNAADVRARIESTCEDLGAAGYDRTFGQGLIDADAAVPSAAPSLDWAGGPGYEFDGIDPDTGAPRATRFRFKVQYADPFGAPPTKAKLRIQYYDANGEWQLIPAQDMVLGSGDPATGAIYRTSRTLGNAVYRYRFFFLADDGTQVGGDPSIWQDGPYIDAEPMLHWPGATGYEGADGMDPDVGASGDRFYFRVRYRDSAGDAPTTAQLLIRRNGKPFIARDLVQAIGGSYRTGKGFRTSLKLVPTGTYEYRFEFQDVSGTATGPPSRWTPGPTVNDNGALAAVTSLAARPTSAGAQITFRLSAPAAITATIHSIAGRPVRTVAVDRACASGTQTLLWDRRSDGGLPVPHGTYLVRVTAKQANGGRSSALAALVIH